MANELCFPSQILCIVDASRFLPFIYNLKIFTVIKKYSLFITDYGNICQMDSTYKQHYDLKMSILI